MTDTADMHEKMDLATDPSIWAPGGPVEDWTTDYDIRDEAYVEDPVPIWAEMRSKCPIAHTERLGGSWNPTKFDDMRELAKMVPELSSRQPLVMPPAPNAPRAEPLRADDRGRADHGRPADPDLDPAHAAAGLRPAGCGAIQRLHRGAVSSADRRLHRRWSVRRRRRLLTADPAAGDRPHDRRGPGMADQFVHWVNMLLGEGINDPEARMKARDELIGFITEEVTKRATDPQEDLLTELLFMELDDEDRQHHARGRHWHHQPVDRRRHRHDLEFDRLGAVASRHESGRSAAFAR